MRHVFIDESCQNAHQYMVLGALVMPGALVSQAEADLGALLNGFAMTAELKWTKVSRAKLMVYEAVIDYHFCELVPAGVEFHTLIVDCHGLDHRTYNQGDPDLGFNKFVYQLLLHKAGRKHGMFERIVVDLDARNSTRNVIELQNALNAKMTKLNGDSARAPFARLAHRDSKSTRLLQLVDLLIGAVAWHKNDHDGLPNSSAAKTALANHAADRIGRRRLGLDSARSESRLSVWNFRLQPRR